jgi:hypothetical protein
MSHLKELKTLLFVDTDVKKPMFTLLLNLISSLNGYFDIYICFSGLGTHNKLFKKLFY